MSRTAAQAKPKEKEEDDVEDAAAVDDSDDEEYERDSSSSSSSTHSVVDDAEPNQKKRRHETRSSRQKIEDVYVILLQESNELFSPYRIQRGSIDEKTLALIQDRHMRHDEFKGHDDWSTWFRLYNDIIDDTKFEAIESGEPILRSGARALGIYLIADPNEQTDQIALALQNNGGGKTKQTGTKTS